MKKKVIVGMLVLAMVLVVLAVAWTAKAEEPTLWDVYEVLKAKEFVDLTHAFEPGIPHWPGFPDEERETLYWYEEGIGTLGAGFFAEKFLHHGLNFWNTS